ncbi:CcdC family protein [Paenibacillus sp. FSL K6-1230]|uniref:CcdC family protein n=1 Tax=Paenibacillus sp. FSL K6-1230 TaxID=2921603 RepID=UPI0030FB9218
MFQINPTYLQYGATFGMLTIALMAIFIRMKVGHRPVNSKTIIMPPVGMATGFAMFVVPDVRIPLLWALASFLIGWFIFSYPLIRSTRFEVQQGQVFVQRSRAFFFILLTLLAVRLLLHELVYMYISIQQTAGVFFILAFGTLTHWRLYMYKEYRKIQPTAPADPHSRKEM